MSTNRALGIWAGIVIAGFALFAASFLAALNPPQCPSYATTMPDGSRCIIGANLGAPLVRAAGLVLVVGGTVRLLVEFVIRSWHKRPR